jgi:hypothetical protein
VRSLGAAIAFALALALARDAGAQQAARRDQPAASNTAPPVQLAAGIDVSVPPSTPSAPVPMGPVIRTANIIADKELQKLLQNGFPANLHYKADLWSRGGLFDDVKASVEWDVLVRYEPLTKTYRVARYISGKAENLGRFERYEDAQAFVARPFQPTIPARRTRDRQYYIVTLEVEVLSMSDLDEVERWLRGELRPAVRGKRNPGTAIGRGLARLTTRLLGGENRRYEQRTETFRIGNTE